MGFSFGVLLLQDRPLDEVLEWGARFDEAGVDSVWVADHLANPFAVDLPWHDPWLVLGALAGATSRCRIGPLVSTYVVHSPLALARRVHTLNVLSGNRLDLGVGAGGAPVDRSMTAVPDASVAELVARMARGIEHTTLLLRGERVAVAPVPTIAGRSAPVDLCLTFAEGSTVVPPLVIGGQGRLTIDVAARVADRWNTFGAGPGGGDVLDAFRRHSELLAERCIAHGRDPSDVTRSVLLDFTDATSAPDRASLGDLVGRMRDLGFDECIAYAWAGSAVTRTPEALLSFVVNDLPDLKRDPR